MKVKNGSQGHREKEKGLAWTDSWEISTCKPLPYYSVYCCLIVMYLMLLELLSQKHICAKSFNSKLSPGIKVVMEIQMCQDWTDAYTRAAWGDSMGKSDFNAFVCGLGFILNYMFMDKLLPEWQDKIGPTVCYSLCKTSPRVWTFPASFFLNPFKNYCMIPLLL